MSPHVFAVKPDLGVKTMKEFVELAKKNPDKFNVSTPPIGTTPQLQAEVLKLREGLQKMATVVFPGGGDALKAVIGRHRAAFVRRAGAGASADQGRQRSRASRSPAPTRWHDLPEIPTMIESGYKDFVFDTYCALMAPAKVPADIVAKLEKTALDILAKPDMKQKLTAGGLRGDGQDRQGPHGARHQGGEDVRGHHHPGEDPEALR